MIKSMIMRWTRFAAAAVHIGVAVVKISVFWPRWSARRRGVELAKWAERAVGIFGFRIVSHGTISGDWSVAPIVVSNHISWLDIYVILARLPAVFVAKNGVRRWPAIGWLAERIGTLFIDREQRRSLPLCIKAIDALTSKGTPVAFFPEATTTLGDAVAPFHAPLFAAATRPGARIQPVSIKYRRMDGSTVEAAAFVDDMSLLESFRRLADCRDCIAEVHWLEPIVTSGLSRQDLAAAAHAAISHAQSRQFFYAEPASAQRGDSEDLVMRHTPVPLV